MTKMLVIPACTAADMEGIDGCDFALIDADCLLAEADKLIEATTRLKEDFKQSSIEIVRFDAMSVISYTLAEDVIDPDTVDRILEDREGAVFDMHQPTLDRIDREEERIDCIQQHASCTEVWWSFYPKYTNVPYETHRISWEKLRAIV